jgi:hypothetical protein
MKIPLLPPFAKGEITPPFRKACLPVGRGDGEGFKKVIFYVTSGFIFNDHGYALSSCDTHGD